MYNSCREIKESILFEILSGYRYRNGERVDTIRECAYRWKVNPNTVHKLYKYMCDKGILNTQIGKGTYLTQDVALVESFRLDIAHYLIMNLHRKLSDLNCTDKEIVEMISFYIKT